MRPDKQGLRRMRLDFLCIGTQKGGTTSLQAYLRRHDHLVVPDHELHFFDDETLNWHHPDFERYHIHFLHPDRPTQACSATSARDEQAQRRLHGEVTPIYLYWEPCMERIHHYNPAIKLIVLLRNPLARAYSHWAMERERGWEELPFAEAIRQEPRRCQEGPRGQHRVYSYLDRGRYAVQLRRLFRFFPRSQVLILRSEQLFKAPTATLRQVTEFLGIVPYPSLNPIHARRGIYPESIPQEVWQTMASIMEGEISALEELLGWNCDAWRRPWSPLA